MQDRIEKVVELRAPRARVWRAISSHEEFGEWFRVVLEGPFVAGQRVSGRVLHPGYEHLKWEAVVETIEPERYFSFRWHPYAVNPEQDYSGEPMTLVEFTLAVTPTGTRLTIVESGFARLPLARRDESFPRNAEGWSIQSENIRKHVDGHA
jgi:uncharacterized protein YndB with AHSA1/START domain